MVWLEHMYQLSVVYDTTVRLCSFEYLLPGGSIMCIDQLQACLSCICVTSMQHKSRITTSEAWEQLC